MLKCSVQSLGEMVYLLIWCHNCTKVLVGSDNLMYCIHVWCHDFFIMESDNQYLDSYISFISVYLDLYSAGNCLLCYMMNNFKGVWCHNCIKVLVRSDNLKYCIHEWCLDFFIMESDNPYLDLYFAGNCLFVL